MFWDLNGATRNPSSWKIVQSALTRSDFPTLDAVPWIIRVRATGDLELPWADESGSGMAWSVRKVLLASPKGF